MKIELKVTIDYDPNGNSFKEIQNQLEYAASTLSGNGLLTGFLDAEVDTWEFAITDITPDCEGVPLTEI